MENVTEQLNHLSEMRKLMNKSSRFLSLSGLSGILCGIYALVASGIVYYLLYVQPNIDPIGEVDFRFKEGYMQGIIYLKHLNFYLVAIGICTLVLSIISAYFLSAKKAKAQGDKVWNSASKNLMIHLLLPLTIGGLLVLICMSKNWFEVVAPFTLIFYGIALISASKYTYGEILYLGILESILGLISLFYVGYGLFFWAAGFGLLHILYGIILHARYERN